MEAIKIENLSFAYPNRKAKALDDISLSVQSGEFITLCGQSGCGKTTLLRLLKPSVAPFGTVSGNRFINESDINSISARDECEKIGIVMQSPENQIVTDKVWHELAFGLEGLGLPTAEIRARVAEMAAFFGIDSWFHQKTTELSGGQKQLLCLASVMVMRPSVLILDEPTSQLDPIAAHEFLKTLKRVNSELGTTVILSEHRLEEALPVSDRVVVLDDGKIVAEGNVGKVSEILLREKHPMFLAFPTSVRVHGVLDRISPCPITVLEGRRWLDSFSENHEFDASQIPKDSNFKSDVIPAIDARGLYFRYSRELPDVVKNFSFKAYSGRVSAIVGGNGAGKSTALSLLSGLLASQRGEVLLFGKKLTKIRKPHDGLLGVLPQNPQSVFAKNTAFLELCEMLQSKGISEQEKNARIKSVSELCEISTLLSFHPYDLSGGEQQRLALAKILLREPKILLLDEPTKGMDARFKDVFGCILNKLKTRGTAIVMVSHDIEFCAEYADECSLFFDGNIVSGASSREFFSNKSFYTTAANRMARALIPEAVLADDIIAAFGGERIQKPDADILPEGGAQTSFPKAENNVKAPDVPKLSKRTLLSALFSLLAIIATVYLGVFVFGNGKYYFLSLLIILEAIVPFCLAFESRKPRARELVTLSVLCAIAVAGRAAFFMVPQFKPVVAVVIIAGVAFGGECGFLVGTITGFVSNFFFGQGPWAPWQMLALGLIGFLAGVFCSVRVLKTSRISLCVFGFVATLVIYGGIMNPASVIMWQAKPTLDMIISAYIVGIPFDLIHALSTVFFLWFISLPMLEKLGRIKCKYNVLC